MPKHARIRRDYLSGTYLFPVSSGLIGVLRWACMPKEIPLQIDMFSGDLVDTRTRKQKQLAKEQEGPRQIEMFSQRELAVFGANAHPRLPISPKTRIELAIEDRRSEEEKARALQREIEENTVPMPWAMSAAIENSQQTE